MSSVWVWWHYLRNQIFRHRYLVNWQHLEETEVKAFYFYRIHLPDQNRSNRRPLKILSQNRKIHICQFTENSVYLFTSSIAPMHSIRSRPLFWKLKQNIIATTTAQFWVLEQVGKVEEEKMKRQKKVRLWHELQTSERGKADEGVFFSGIAIAKMWAEFTCDCEKKTPEFFSLLIITEDS